MSIENKCRAKKIWLQAYCHENLGDDLFVRIITGRYPDCQFFLMSNGENRELRKIPNLTILPETFGQKAMRKLSPGYIAYNRLIRSCDTVVLIGGSMFIEQENWKNRLAAHAGLVKKARRFCVIGSNFGPYQSKSYLDGYKSLFAQMDDCCFRDERTWRLFSELNNTHWAPDIAFTTQMKAPDDRRKKFIAVSVVNLGRKAELAKYYPAYLEGIRNAVQDFQNEGWEVMLLSFCQEQGDLQCCEDICAGLSIKPVVRNYCGNLDEMLEAIRSAEYILATRFHGMILGWLSGCRVFPLIYDEKMESVLDDLGLRQSARSVRDMTGLRMEEILENAQCLPGRERVVKEAQKQFAYLDEIESGMR